MQHKTTVAVFCMVWLAGCDRKPAPVASKATAATNDTSSEPTDKPMHFDHHEFVLDLAPSWTTLSGTDPKQFQFESKPLASTLTISVVPAGIPRARMQEVAEKFSEIRREAEGVDTSRVVTFGDQWVKPKPDEEVVEIGYAGYDDRGRIFRFMGFVTTHKVVSFYCETVTDDNEQAKRAFDEAFRGFRYYVP